MNKILISLLLSSLLLNLNANESADKIAYLHSLSLEELMNIEVSSSTRKTETINKAPSVMYAITDQQIKARGYKTLLDVLQHVPGWDISSPNGNWVGQYASIRGTRGLRQILLSVDGVVQNNINDFEAGRFHTFLLKSVKRIEIINGPSSALYGANALLGVINIISKKADDIDGVALSVSATTNTVSDDWYKQDVNILFGQTITDDIGIMASFDFVNSTDSGEHYSDPNGIYTKGTPLSSVDDINNVQTVADDGFDNHQKDYHFKLRLNKANLIKIGFDYSDMDDGLGSFLDGSSYFVNSSQTDYKWHVTRLSSFITGVYEVNDEIKIEPKLYYREDEIKDDSGFAYTYDRSSSFPIDEPKPAGTMRNYQQKTSRIGVDFATRYEPSDALSILLGYNHETDDTESEYSSWYPKDSNNRFIRTLNSGYMQLLYDVTENLNFLLGGRYDKENGLDGVWIPRTALVHTLNMDNESQLITKLMYGESFRALATYEKAPNADNPSKAGLVPEKAKTYEFQILYIPTQKQKYNVSLWYSEIENLRINGTDGYNKINGEEKDYRDQTTFGLQASVDIELTKELDFLFNYTYTDGENKNMYYQDEDRNLPDEIMFNDLIHVAKHKFNAGLNYQYSSFLNFNIMARYVGEKKASPFDTKFRDAALVDDLENENSIGGEGDGYIPSYFITDFMLNYQSQMLQNLSAYFQVNNLFDEQYVDPRRYEGWWVPYYHPQAGRTISVGLEYKF